MPESPKYRPQKLSCGAFPHNRAYCQTGAVAQPQVTVTDSKGQIQPCGKDAQYEQQVGKSGALFPQGAQESVDKSQSQSYGAGGQQICRNQLGIVHPNRRFNQPPRCRGSS